MIARNFIQNLAEQTAKDAGFTSLPVCPFKTAENADITVQAKPQAADGVSGMLLKSGDNFGIMYATNIQSSGFQHFAISHELGHYFLEGHSEAILKLDPASGGGLFHASRAGFVSNDRFEREADQFAAALLMPEDAFRLAMKSRGTGMQAIESLASLAKPSLPATAFRYHELTNDAVDVVLSSFDEVNVCFYSDRFKDIVKPTLPYFKKGTPVPHGTLTRQFNQNKANVLGGASEEDQTRFADWFGIDGPVVREQVQGLGGYGKTLTVITCTAQADDDFDADEQADDDEFLKENWTPRFRR